MCVCAKYIYSTKKIRNERFWDSKFSSKGEWHLLPVAFENLYEKCECYIPHKIQGWWMNTSKFWVAFFFLNLILPVNSFLPEVQLGLLT